MSDDNKSQGQGSQSARDIDYSQIRRGGYQPLQEGYRPNVTERGYSADMVGNTGLPKAPEGGTGQSPPVSGEKK
jgi:hypothetical protein